MREQKIRHGILEHIEAADIPPTDENLEEQKAELIKLADQAETLFTPRKNLLKLPSIADNHWFVVGDLHGDYRSLRRLLVKIFSHPDIDTDKVRIIFLGDYIDRGQRPVQVLRLLLRIINDFPETFFPLKGNHELLREENGAIKSHVYPCDFIDLWKPHLGEDVFRSLKKFFDALPCAYLHDDRHLQHRILYVHGGIPRTEHTREPLDSAEAAAGFLWSDPEDKARVENGPGRRFSFGTDDFNAFMNAHKLSTMVRSHEAKPQGFDSHPSFSGKSQRLLTVYSTGYRENEDSGYRDSVDEPCFLQLQTSDNNHYEFRHYSIFKERFAINLLYDTREGKKRVQELLATLQQKVFTRAGETTKSSISLQYYPLFPDENSRGFIYDYLEESRPQKKPVTLDISITIMSTAADNSEGVLLENTMNNSVMYKKIQTHLEDDDFSDIADKLIKLYPILKNHADSV